MSNNVEIEEAGRSRQFSGIESLEIDTVEGDSSLWVPQEERKLESGLFFYNGTYMPQKYGFDEAKVNVFDHYIDDDGIDWTVDIHPIDIDPIDIHPIDIHPIDIDPITIEDILEDLDIDIDIDDITIDDIIDIIESLDIDIDITVEDIELILDDLDIDIDDIIPDDIIDIDIDIDDLDIIDDIDPIDIDLPEDIDLSIPDLDIDIGVDIETGAPTLSIDGEDIELPDMDDYFLPGSEIDISINPIDDSSFDVDDISIDDLEIDFTGIDMEGVDVDISIPLSDLPLDPEGPQPEAEYLPTNIEVTTPPSQMRYRLSEEFNPSGMVVSATYRDGYAIWANEKYPNGIIPLAELSFQYSDITIENGNCDVQLPKDTKNFGKNYYISFTSYRTIIDDPGWHYESSDFVMRIMDCDDGVGIFGYRLTSYVGRPQEWHIVIFSDEPGKVARGYINTDDGQTQTRSPSAYRVDEHDKRTPNGLYYCDILQYKDYRMSSDYDWSQFIIIDNSEPGSYYSIGNLVDSIANKENMKRNVLISWPRPKDGQILQTELEVEVYDPGGTHYSGHF